MYLFDRFVYCVCEHKKINLRRSKKRGITVLTFSRGSHFADGTEYSQKVWDVGISGEMSGWVSTTNAQLQICGRWLLFQVAKSPITTRWQTLDLILLPTITWVSQTFFFFFADLEWLARTDIVPQQYEYSWILFSGVQNAVLRLMLLSCLAVLCHPSIVICIQETPLHWISYTCVKKMYSQKWHSFRARLLHACPYFVQI